VVSAAASEIFRFKSPYKMADHISIDNGIHWNDGHMEYRELLTVVNEPMASFAHLYAYGVSKYTFLAGLKGRPIHNLEDINCLSPESFNNARWCNLHCHNFPIKSVHSLYDW